MKKIIKVIMIITISLSLLTGCERSEVKIKASLDGFINEMKESDSKGAEKYLIKSNIENNYEIEKSNNKYVASFIEYLKSNTDYFENNIGKLEYNIENVEIKDDKATAEVSFKYINGEKVFKETMEDLMEYDLYRDYVDKNTSGQEIDSLISERLKANEESIEAEYIEEVININFTKVDGDFLIDGIDESLYNVLKSNLNNSLLELELDGEVDEELDGLGEFEGGSKDNISGNIIEKGLGEEIKLKDYSISINTIEETDQLGDGQEVILEAKDNKKFIVLELDFIKTSDSGVSTENIKLIDDKGKEYKIYEDNTEKLKDYISPKKVLENKNENAIIAFEIEGQVSGYSLFIEDKGTDNIYEIVLR